MVLQAESLAERIVLESQDDAQRLAAAFRLVFAREPTAAERQAGTEFLAGCGDMKEQDRWMQFAQVLLASNELLIVD
jgi:hypothetical protein